MFGKRAGSQFRVEHKTEREGVALVVGAGTRISLPLILRVMFRTKWGANRSIV